MRKKEEIINGSVDSKSSVTREYAELEVLIDIRDILNKLTKK